MLLHASLDPNMEVLIKRLKVGNTVKKHHQNKVSHEADGMF